MIGLLMLCAVLPQTGDSSRVTFNRYPDLDEINSYLDKIHINFHNFVRIESIGRSHENRKIKLVKIFRHENNRSVWIDGGNGQWRLMHILECMQIFIII